MNFKTSNKEIIISSVEKSDTNNVGTHVWAWSVVS